MTRREAEKRVKGKMYCPCCESELVKTHQGKYETLSEHVSQPNAGPSMKQGYGCPNEYCVANNLNGTWIRGGEFYMDPPAGIKWTVAHNAVKASSKTGSYDALNSWQHFYNSGKKKQKSWKFTVKIPFTKHKFTFIPKDKGYKYPDHEQYQPAWWKWKWSYEWAELKSITKTTVIAEDE